MDRPLPPLDQQVIVLTGASSGIGLATARMAADRGARLVLAARSGEALNQLVDEITARGGQAIAVTADVSKEEDIRGIVEAAITHFGGFDTWINNAGISIYGELLDVPIADMRSLFETNFWGLVYGSLYAARHLSPRGGTIINVGSTLSDRAIILQGIYSASKHAVKGFTDALRMELEASDAPVSVTLIKPAAIDTPYVQNAKNYMEAEPQNPPPIYAAEAVAKAILHCAEKPQRDLFVGGGGKFISLLGHYAPRLTDVIMENVMARQQKSRYAPGPRADNGLDAPSERLQQSGGYEGHVAKSSLYTTASLHPALTGATLLGAGLAAVALWRVSRPGQGSGKLLQSRALSGAMRSGRRRAARL